MPFAVAASRHPVASIAVGEMVGEIIEAIGTAPSLAVLFVTQPVIGVLDDVVGAIQHLLDPDCLVGVTAGAVLAGSEGIENTAALVLWAAVLDEPVMPVRLTAVADGDGGYRFDGLDLLADLVGDEQRSLVLLTDPFSFPADQFVAAASDRMAGLRVSGGLASAANAPMGNRLVLGDVLHRDGAVGFVLPDARPTVVAQGCRPIGHPFIVTKSERNIIYELGGKPALERLMEEVNGLSPEDRALAAKGLHCGIVVDERVVDFTRGDFLIRGVLGADRDIGAVAVGAEVPVGCTVQFQVRDPETAAADLASLLEGKRADGALVFTCNGRGSFMFGTANHDAEIIDELLTPTGPRRPAIAGMFAAGELGPVGPKNAVHGFTASLALFTD
jgi:small ligand-binding sensory domain FIST